MIINLEIAKEFKFLYLLSENGQVDLAASLEFSKSKFKSQIRF